MRVLAEFIWIMRAAVDSHEYVTNLKVLHQVGIFSLLHDYQFTHNGSAPWNYVVQTVFGKINNRQ